MAVISCDHMGLKDISEGKAYVADNPTAKLMFYLHCVFKVVGKENLPYDVTRLCEFEQYYEMTRQDKQLILTFAEELGPSVVRDRIFFESSQLTGDDFGNCFYEVSQVSTTLAVSASITIGGVRHKVFRIMAYSNNFMERYYFSAVPQLHRQLIESEPEPEPRPECRIL